MEPDGGRNDAFLRIRQGGNIEIEDGVRAGFVMILFSLCERDVVEQTGGVEDGPEGFGQAVEVAELVKEPVAVLGHAPGVIPVDLEGFAGPIDLFVK
jgi:hypothetical protein